MLGGSLPRTFVLAAAVLCGVVSLAGCTSSTAESEPVGVSASDGAFPVTIDHVFGETTVVEQPQRIVALGSGTTGDILFALGIEPVGLEVFPGFGAANDEGVQPWVEPHLDTAATTLLPEGTVGLEKIAALAPDLILITYGGLEEGTYEQLNKIAPTVASPQGQWELDWRLELRTVARAVGMTNEATDIEHRLDEFIEGVRAAHPQLNGVSYTFVEVNSEVLWPYLTADPRNQLIQELGLVSSPGVQALDVSTDGAFVADVSLENASDLDADVVIAFPSSGSAESLYRAPTFGQIEAVKRGSVVLYGQEKDIIFLSSMVPSPLTIPISVQRIATDISTALAAHTP